MYSYKAADGRFEPHLNTSRAMITTILWKLEGGPEAKNAQPFPDVEDGQWYTEAITWAAEKGIVQGYGNGKFGPDDPITREQMVLILWHYAGRPETAGELTGFSDGDTVSSWVYPAMEWGIEQGIITGKTGNILDPKGKASRAEVATMLMRYCQLQK